MENLNAKYRPSRFADVVGQASTVKLLKKIAAADELPVNSIVLKGSYGSGKTTLARIMAKALNCRSMRSTGDVCNECSGCLSSTGTMSSTYVEYDTSMVGNVEFIRGLSDRLSYTSELKRLVVFDECHTASKQAMNGMLKILEEGIENTLFMFCTTENVLPTIESRSIVCDIMTIPIPMIAERLLQISAKEGIQMDDKIAETIAVKSLGHMRNALSILQHYAMIGEDAVQSSYVDLENYMRRCLAGDCTAEHISALYKYPVADITVSVSRFCNHLYTDSMYCNVLKQRNYRGTKGALADVICEYWFSPVTRQMMRTEGGLETALLRFSNLFKIEV